jgi:hypothetical protein
MLLGLLVLCHDGDMTLSIPTDKPLRATDDLARLVTAITTATDTDETHYLEWKSDYDLTSSEGQFKVARTILGMANRPVELAARFFGGVGYMVVGAEVNNVAGTRAVDSAILQNGIGRYLGIDGPEWYPQSVTVDGKTVLVFVVEPPKIGSFIFTLDKTFQPADGKNGADAGSIFIRKSGKTERANPGDIRMLSQRLKGGEIDASASLAVTWFRQEPVPFIDVSQSALNQRIEYERELLMHRRRITAGPYSFLGRLDSRTVEQFETEVSSYLGELRNAIPEFAKRVTGALVEDRWSLSVENLGATTLSNVRISIVLPRQIELVTNTTGPRLPRRPKEFGEDPMGMAIPLGLLDHPLPFEDAIYGVEGGPSVRKHPEGWEIRQTLGSLHAFENEVTSGFSLIGITFPRLESVNGIIDVRVSATAENRRGVVEYMIPLQVMDEEPFTPMTLFGTSPISD